MDYDLFVSYARADDLSGHVEALIELIAAEYRTVSGGIDLRVFFDRDAIRGMDDWRHRILEGLKRSKLMAAFISPAYFQSDNCGWEFNEYLKHESARAFLGEGIAPLYLYHVPELHLRPFPCDIAEWMEELSRRQRFEFREWPQLRDRAAEDVTLTNSVSEVVRQLHTRLSRAQGLADLRGNVDRHNEFFVGRRSELRRLRELTGLGRIGVLTAIHGLGGIGKTAIATEYSYTFAHEYPGGRWQINCEGQNDLRSALSSLVRARDLDFEFDEGEIRDPRRGMERALRELKSRADEATPSRVLLVLENVTESRLLEPAQVQALPRADWLHVIATTRLGASDLYSEQADRDFLAVDELPEWDAVELMEAYQPYRKFSDESENIAAVDIVRLLGCFTLAVENAAVFLGQFPDVTCSAFRERLVNEGLEAIEAAASEPSVAIRHGEKSLRATLGPTLERLSGASLLAISFAALLPHDNVPLSWLRSLVSHEFPETSKDASEGFPDPWQRVVRQLLSLHLLTPKAAPRQEPSPNLTRMHVLVRQVVAERITSRRDELTSQIVVYATGRARELGEHWTERERRWELEPLRSLSWRLVHAQNQDATELAYRVAQILYHLGRYTESEFLLRQLLDVLKLPKESDELAMADSANLLSLNLAERGNDLEAELYSRMAAPVYVRRFGKRNWRVAALMNNDANRLLSDGRAAEALRMMQKALSIDENEFGGRHPAVARDLVNLAECFLALGKARKAEKLCRRALPQFEEFAGTDHPDYAQVLHSFAACLRAQGRVEEAEAYAAQALNICRRVFGDEHHRTASAENGLAVTLKLAGKASDAEALYISALKKLIRYTSNGWTDHPDLSVTAKNYLGLLESSRKLSDEECIANLNDIAVPLGLRFSVGPGKTLRCNFVLPE